MPTVSFTLIQANLSWEDPEANRRMFEEKIRSIPFTHVVLLPEMFSTGFSMRPDVLAEPMTGPTVSWMKALAADKRIILAGSLMIEEGGKYFNRFLWVLPNGQLGYYDKRHLFAYAEEDKHYIAGSERFIASVNGFKVNLLVCYDLRFPVWSRQSPGADGFEYDVLVYVANWPERRNHAWKTLLRARAIENQCYVIGLNRVGTDGKDIAYTGDSAVIGPLGETLYERSNDEDVFTITLDKAQLDTLREKLPFHADADDFMIINGPA